MTWKVQMFPEEQAFIDKVWANLLDNQDGRGQFIAPLSGGLIYLNYLKDKGYDEDQMKWLVFNELQHPRFRRAGFVGIKFMNFSWHDPIPTIEEDAEAMDRWGVPRQTTDGQPIGQTGLPVDRIATKEVTYKHMKWDPEKKAYSSYHESHGEGIELEDFNTQRPLPARILE